MEVKKVSGEVSGLLAMSLQEPRDRVVSIVPSEIAFSPVSRELTRKR